MEQEILNRLQAQEEILLKIYTSSEKTRKYFMWTLYGTLAIFVLPLTGLMFAIPTFMSMMGSVYGI